MLASLGVDWRPPAGLARESALACFRAGPSADLAEAGLRAPVRPSLVVERRAAPAATLPACVAGVQEDLARAIPGLRGFDALDVAFADGAHGVVIGYTFPAPRVAEVILCQLRALRLDEGTLSSLTVTTTLSHLTEARRDQLLRILTSARLAAPAAAPGASDPEEDTL